MGLRVSKTHGDFHVVEVDLRQHEKPKIQQPIDPVSRQRNR